MRGAEPDALRASAPRAPARSPRPRDVGAELDVLQRRQPGEQVEGLEDEADPAAPEGRQRRAGRAGDVLAGHHDPPLGGRVEGADEVEQRRLAAARGPQHHDELAPVDRQVDVLEGADRRVAHPVAARDPLERDQVAHARGSRVGRRGATGAGRPALRGIRDAPATKCRCARAAQRATIASSNPPRRIRDRPDGPRSHGRTGPRHPRRPRRAAPRVMSSGAPTTTEVAELRGLVVGREVPEIAHRLAAIRDLIADGGSLRRGSRAGRADAPPLRPRARRAPAPGRCRGSPSLRGGPRRSAPDLGEGISRTQPGATLLESRTITAHQASPPRCTA